MTEKRTIEFYDKCPVCGSIFKSVTMEFTNGRCSMFNAICNSPKCGASFNFETYVKVLKITADNEDFTELSTSSKDAHCKWNDMCARMTRERREERNNA